MVDLNNLIPQNSGWTIENATGINASGQIACDGVGPDGVEHALLLTPNPVVIKRVSTTDSKSLEITYNVISNPSDATFPLDVYRSATDTPNPDEVKIAEVSLSGTNAAVGEHTITIDPLGGTSKYQFLQAQALRPDPLHEYVLATADAGGALGAVDQTFIPHASFRIWLVGAVTHGFVGASDDTGASFIAGYYPPGTPNPAAVQSFLDNFKDDLVQDDGYDLGVAFHWENYADFKAPGMTYIAGEQSNT